MVDGQSKVLVLSSHSGTNMPLVDCLKASAAVVEIATIDEAIELLRHESFDAIFSDAADFLPLERALISQQASLILNTLGEGVCIVDGEGRCNWMNKKMQAWPARVHEKIRRTCQEAYELFTKQTSNPAPASPPQHSELSTQPSALPPATNRSRRYALNNDDQLFFEMIASPVINPA